MAQLEADVSPIIVDSEVESTGTTNITYVKDFIEELWERTDDGPWSQINVFSRTGRGDDAEYEGKYVVTLKPGQSYEVSVYSSEQGPLSTDPLLRATVKVFCLWKKPEVRHLISDHNRAFGGTWYSHQIATTTATRLVTIGVSRNQPKFDDNGIPHLFEPDGAPSAPLGITNNHIVEIAPLFPGHHYFFVVVVADAFGNWEVWMEEFTTLRRKITVQFQKLIILNDGDPSSHGEGEFWFRVYTGLRTQPEVVEDFHLPTMDIDDWGEKGRPYSVGFAHLGALEVVNPERSNVAVSSWAIEHDGIFDSDEGADGDRSLPLPAGQSVETVTNRTFRMDCPVSTVDDDFHYGVDVLWSVEYAI